MEWKLMYTTNSGQNKSGNHIILELSLEFLKVPSLILFLIFVTLWWVNLPIVFFLFFSEVNLAVAAYISDTVIDGVIETLNDNHKTLVLINKLYQSVHCSVLVLPLSNFWMYYLCIQNDIPKESECKTSKLLSCYYLVFLLVDVSCETETVRVSPSLNRFQRERTGQNGGSGQGSDQDHYQSRLPGGRYTAQLWQ